ncbi:MAG: hypothetical protein VCB42_02965 [Myxococcota bacterium]
MRYRRIPGSSQLRILLALAVLMSSWSAVASEKPVLPPPPAPTADEANPESTWYAMALGRIGGRPAVAHFWSKGSKLRSETVIFGRPILTLVDKNYYYTIDVLDRKGLAIQRSPLSVEQDADRMRPFALEWEDMFEAGGEKVRSEKSGSEETEVWRLTNVSGRQTVWVSANEERLLLRVETYDRGSSTTDRVEYVNWQTGLAIPDSFFHPGSDVRIRRMEYKKYIQAARKGPVGPAPPLYRYLLHGRRKPTE